MCGICLILDYTGRITSDPIRQMLEVLTHRGPDSNSFTYHKTDNSQLFCGATRLKVVEDNSNADQPFFSTDRSSLLLFNGEVYNFFDLKNELIKDKVEFRSNSDTETVLYWLNRYQEAGIQNFEGMFALIHISLKTNKILLARDRFGMKPLYYYHDKNFLIVSSEIRAILASGLVKKELNESQIPYYFNFRYPEPPFTFFKQIYSIPVGYFMIVENGCLEKPTKYNFPEYDDQIYSIDGYRKLLRESFYRQTYSDCGIGILYSGGIDSSLLLALSHESGMNLPCFSIFNTTRESREERKQAQLLPKKFMADHEILEIDSHILNDFIPYIDKLDQPISDSAGLLTFLISGYASKKVKVLLSGAGADELFGGYNRHLAFYKYLQHQNVSLKIKKYLWPFLKGFLSDQMNVYFSGIEMDYKKTYLNFVRSHFSNLSNWFPVEKELTENSFDLLRNVLLEDKFNYLPNDVLAISDTMSMAASVEMRMPFLDNHLNDVINRSHPDYLLGKGSKWILKEMLSEYANPSYLKQKKAGFGLPLRKWLAENKYSQLWDLFANKNSYIFRFVRPEFFNYLLTSHQRYKGDFSQELWSILTLAYWLEKEFN